MSTTYAIVRPLLRFLLDFYFVDIQAEGAERIRREGPVILASNHPNSLMDTAVLSTVVPRKIHFLARSGLFKRRWAAVALRRMGAIPIYRVSDSAPGEGRADEVAQQNARAFTAVYEVLGAGRCLGVFPEGKNSPVAQVLDIKTGTARMALASEAQHGFELGLEIVPIGINFVARERFLSAVLVRCGEPLRVADWRATWERDPREAVGALTETLQRAIRDQALHIREERQRDLVRSLDRVMGQEILVELLGHLKVDRKTLRERFFDELRATPYRRRDLDATFHIKQYIADVVSALEAQDIESFEVLEQRVHRYEDHAAQVHVRHDLVLDGAAERTSLRREVIKATAYGVACAPVAAWGWLNNIVPAVLVWLGARRVREEAIRAITVFALAVIVFPLFYGAQVFMLWTYDVVHAPWALALYVLTLPASGFFALRYRRQLRRSRQRMLARLLFRSDRELLTTLSRERRELVDLFYHVSRRTKVPLPEGAIGDDVGPLLD